MRNPIRKAFVALLRKFLPGYGLMNQYVGDNTLICYTRYGFYIYLEARDVSLTPHILRSGVWEEPICRFIRGNLGQGGTFVDIGANNGFHALLAARHAGPSATVIAFEPQARMCQLLERSARANLLMDRLVIERLAIGAEPGTARLGKFADFFGSATLTENQLIAEHEDVAVAPLGAALAAIEARRGKPIVPDMILIDVEGYEYHTWNGMKEWTRSLDSLTVILEFSPVSYRDMGNDPRRLLAEFGEYGFTLSLLERDGSLRLATGQDCDAMAASNTQFDIVIRK
jgi:FkbM family methyltransferase